MSRPLERDSRLVCSDLERTVSITMQLLRETPAGGQTRVDSSWSVCLTWLRLSARRSMLAPRSCGRSREKRATCGLRWTACLLSLRQWSRPAAAVWSANIIGAFALRPRGTSASSTTCVNPGRPQPTWPARLDSSATPWRRARADATGPARQIRRAGRGPAQLLSPIVAAPGRPVCLRTTFVEGTLTDRAEHRSLADTRVS
jgi:hypothetical protein